MLPEGANLNNPKYNFGVRKWHFTHSMSEACALKNRQSLRFFCLFHNNGVEFALMSCMDCPFATVSAKYEMGN